MFVHRLRCWTSMKPSFGSSSCLLGYVYIQTPSIFSSLCVSQLQLTPFCLLDITESPESTSSGNDVDSSTSVSIPSTSGDVSIKVTPANQVWSVSTQNKYRSSIYLNIKALTLKLLSKYHNYKTQLN